MLFRLQHVYNTDTYQAGDTIIGHLEKSIVNVRFENVMSIGENRRAVGILQFRQEKIKKEKLEWSQKETPTCRRLLKKRH